MAVVTQHMSDELKQRMADLKVRGTYCPAGYLVFSMIDFIQHARIDTPTYGDATCLFNNLKNHHDEDFRGHVLMISLPRGNSTYQTPAMTLRQLQMLLRRLGDKVEPEFRRSFEGIIASIAQE
jgi:hypothetical protein